jgi:glycosyltransferase involved in cell wall biosynthesis
VNAERLHIALVGPLHPRALAHHLRGAANIPDGPPTPVNELADALLTLGHRVSVYTPLLACGTTAPLVGENLDINFVPYRTRVRTRALDFFRVERRELEKELKNSEADVIHVHWTYELAFAAIKSGKVPLLVTAHDAPLTIFRFMPNAYRLICTAMAIRTRFAIRELTAVSPYLAHRWRIEMFYRRPISVIPNIVPDLPPPAASTVRRRWQILDVADGSRRKNVRNLIRAFALVLKSYPQAELRLVGDGLAAENPIADWARSRQLDVNVTFVGPVDRAEIANEYARASVFCHSSLEESHGVSIIEALDAGLPVIAGKNSGAVPWVLFDGQAGKLVDVRAPAAIAAAISDAFGDPSSTVAPGFDVARAITDRYGPGEVAAAYLVEYRRIIERDQSNDR